MNVFELAASLTLNTDEYEKKLASAGSDTEGLGSKFESVGSKFSSIAKKIAAAVGVAFTVDKIKDFVSGSLEAYAAYEQFVGGVDTLFKESSATVQKYADNAYKTAGLSANEYMETVTSFSASLLQSLGGDTAAAAEQADLAITDMADNANKMGTAMESIQDAYQGFAKQNYTMLDNLKLGYGGTKEEMERLIADANELRAAQGLNADLTIDSYADVVTAIHEVQTEMGITGTTAAEASDTIEGSINSMKAAWENLKVGFASGDDEQFATYLDDFNEALQDAAENVIPRVGEIIGTAIESLPEIFSSLKETVVETLDDVGNTLAERFPALAGVFENLETIVPAVTEAFIAFAAALGIAELIQGVITIITTFSTVINTVRTAFTALNAVMMANPFILIATLIATVVAALITLYQTNDTFRDKVNAAWNAVKTTVETVVNALRTFFTETLPNAVMTAITAVTTLPSKLRALGLEAIMGLINAISSKFGELKAKAGEIVTTIVGAITGAVGQMISAGGRLVQGLADGITSFAGKVVSAIGTVKDRITGAFSNAGSMLYNVGSQIINGLVKGIKGAVGKVTGAISNVVNTAISSAKSLLGIASPSKVFRDEVGLQVGLGLAKGIEAGEDEAKKAAKELAEEVYSTGKDWIDDYTKYEETSLREQLELWETFQSQFIESSEQYADAEEQVLDLRKQILQENADLEEEYASQVEDRAKEIFDSFKLFDAIPESEAVNGSTLIKNLEGQVDAIESFYTRASELQTRLAELGLSTALGDDVREMGTDASDELSAILAMTDEQLTQYADLYQQKSELSTAIAVEELETLHEETQESIRANLDALQGIYEQEAPAVGEALPQGMAEGIKAGESTVISAAVSVAKAAIRAAKSTLGVHSPSTVFAEIGENLANGLSKGWTESIGQVKQDITDSLAFGEVGFGDSGLGLSSAGIINGITGQGGQIDQPIEINLVLPGGTALASYLLGPLTQYAQANGTPILNPV